MDPSVPRMRTRVRIGKWVTFAASCVIQVCAGLSYSFSIYGPAIKDRLGLTQVEVSTVGSAVNFGGYFAILSGAVYDATKRHHRIGPRLVIAIGSVCVVCGYLGLWMTSSGRASGGLPELLLFAVCAGNGGTWFDTSALVTNVRNFPNSRGFVVGILKAFLGLSASVYASIYAAFFAPDAISFLLVLAFAPTAVCTLASVLVNYVPFVEASERPGQGITTERRFLAAFFLVAAIAVYQCASALLVATEDLGRRARAGLASGCLALVSLVCVLPVRTGGLWSAYHHEFHPDDAPARDDAFPSADDDAGAPRGAACEPLLGVAARPTATSAAGGRGGDAEAGADGSAGRGGGEKLASLPSMSTVSMLGTAQHWCLFLQFLVGTGVALSMLNNMGQLVVALGGPPGGHVVLVSLFSVSNATGRLVMGYLPEAVLHNSGTPRPVFLVAVAAGMALTSLAAAYCTLGELYPTTVVMGLLFGSHWSLLPAICSDLFGLAHFGSNYTFLQFAPAIGSYSLATRLTGHLYDRAATAHGDPAVCLGPDCFREAFLLLAGLAAMSTLACVLCTLRSRPAYRLLAEHFKQVEEHEGQLAS